MNQDVIYMKKLLPDHYTVTESENGVHCKSSIGIKVNGKGEDEEHFEYIFMAIKQHFKERFQEVYHQTCTYHQSFTVYLKK